MDEREHKRIHVTSRAVEAIALYSASVLDLELETLVSDFSKREDCDLRRHRIPMYTFFRSSENIWPRLNNTIAPTERMLT